MLDQKSYAQIAADADRAHAQTLLRENDELSAALAYVISFTADQDRDPVRIARRAVEWYLDTTLLALGEAALTRHAQPSQPTLC